MGRIYGKVPFVPEDGAPNHWDVEVRNSTGKVLWYGECEYDLDEWRSENVFRKSWVVRLRIFNEGYCISSYKWRGDDYVAAREIELRARRALLSPEGRVKTAQMIVLVWDRVSGTYKEMMES